MSKQMLQTIMEQLDNIEFIQPKKICPYVEVDDEFYQDYSNSKMKLEYNGMYRYAEIVDAIFKHEEMTEKEKCWMYDLILHCLLPIEFRNGVDRKEYRLRMKSHEITAGVYGQRIKEIYIKLSTDCQYRISEALLRQAKTGASITLFGELCSSILDNIVLYKNSIDEKVLIMCCDVLSEQKNSDKLYLLKQLFLPLDYEVRIISEGTISVIGEAITMLPNHMILF